MVIEPGISRIDVRVLTIELRRLIFIFKCSLRSSVVKTRTSVREIPVPIPTIYEFSVWKESGVPPYKYAPALFINVNDLKLSFNLFKEINSASELINTLKKGIGRRKCDMVNANSIRNKQSKQINTILERHFRKRRFLTS